MLSVNCSICGMGTAHACWAKLGTLEQKGWLCMHCYNDLWNVLDRNEG